MSSLKGLTLMHRKLWHVMPIFTLLCLIVPFYSLQGQTSNPDDIQIIFVTGPYLATLNPTQIQATETGVNGTFVVYNPLNELFLDFKITEGTEFVDFDSPIDNIWGQIGLIPAHDDITLKINFDSLSQQVRLETDLLSPKAFGFNAIKTAAGFIPQLASVRPSTLAETLLQIPHGLDRLITIGEAAKCFIDDTPPTIADIPSCVSDVADIIGEDETKALLIEIGRQLGVEISSQAINLLTAARAYVSKIALAVDSLIIVEAGIAARTQYNRYTLRASTSRPVSRPLPPQLIAPLGERTVIRPTFEWQQASGIEQYQIQVSDNDEFLTLIMDENVDGFSYVPSISLQEDTIYHWRVRGLGALTGPWSNGIFRTEAGESSLENNYVTPLLDLIFVIDTTGSMEDDIEAVKTEARQIVNNVAASTVSWQIGIVTYRDQPVTPYGDADDYQSRIEVPFSSEREDIIGAINAIEVGGGGDESESVYSGIMTAIGFGWRDGAKKAIIVMGDAPPHDPEPITGYTMSSVLQAAFDIDPANIYTLLIAEDSQTKKAFQTLSDGSSGRLFHAQDASVVVETLTTTIENIAFVPELSRLVSTGGYARVYTTEGFNLRMRSGPDLDYPIVNELPFGTTVTILGGPEFGAPYLWWNIRAPDGSEGWSVEAADGLITLIPVNEPTAELSVTAFPPIDRQSAVRKYQSIWSITNNDFVNMTSPGTVEYSAVVDAHKTYRLAFFWCADTPQTLQAILKPLTVKFSIDGNVLTDFNLLRSTVDDVCEAWETLLKDWPEDQAVILEIQYTINSSVYDGKVSYDPGDYYQRINVTAR